MFFIDGVFQGSHGSILYVLYSEVVSRVKCKVTLTLFSQRMPSKAGPRPHEGLVMRQELDEQPN